MGDTEAASRTATRRGGIVFAMVAANVVLPAYAADRLPMSAFFDPNPAATLVPIIASVPEARQVTFGVTTADRAWMTFSRGAPKQGWRGFAPFARQITPAEQRSKAKPSTILPIGCEALGSIKSPLGRRAGRCIASL